VYEETLTGRPHDTSVQKAATDNENVDAVTLTSCPGHHSVWMQFNVMPRTHPPRLLNCVLQFFNNYLWLNLNRRITLTENNMCIFSITRLQTKLKHSLRSIKLNMFNAPVKVKRCVNALFSNWRDKAWEHGMSKYYWQEWITWKQQSNCELTHPGTRPGK